MAREAVGVSGAEGKRVGPNREARVGRAWRGAPSFAHKPIAGPDEVPEPRYVGLVAAYFARRDAGRGATGLARFEERN